MSNIRSHSTKFQSIRHPGVRDLCTLTLYDYHVTTDYYLPGGTIRFRVLS
jgi:hypothetical protein